MKKSYFILLFSLGIKPIFAQVGINTTTPNAQLEIKSSDQAAPSNTDGILIPKVDTFPATNPTAAQQGMMVYLTTTFGTNSPGFYYWDNAGTPSWRPITGTSGSTLDQAYDFGGAGNGRTITADAGAVIIDGTDGFVSSGMTGSGAIAPSGLGVKMFWNPRKAAFRAGKLDFNPTLWDDINIGERSTAFGGNTTASGNASVAFGAGTVASGLISTAFGNSTEASNIFSTAFGAYTVASGTLSTAFGRFSVASGTISTAFGSQNTAPSYGETVLGIGATNYTPSTNGATQFTTANATDRLLVVGNAIDANNNFNVDVSERSDALIILKNGLTRLPSTTNAMINAADGKAVVTKEYLQNTTSGTLDQAYDFGGAGFGNTITADAGALTINGTDGFVSTGTSNTGAIVPSGPGIRMVWNPRKGAFRAGLVTGTEWDDVNVGGLSTSFGFNTRASGGTSTAFGNRTRASGGSSTAFGFSTIATGESSTAFGYETNANGDVSTAFGYGTTASGQYATAFGINTLAQGNGSTAFGENTICYGIYSTAFGLATIAGSEFSTAFGRSTIAAGANATAFGYQSTAGGEYSTAFGGATTASGFSSTSFGAGTVASGSYATAFGRLNSAVGNVSTASGQNNVARSFGETVLGIGATDYTPSTNGASRFGTSNSSDRLLVVGNAIDNNNNSLVDFTERSDALVLLKNGNLGIGSSIPQETLHVVGNLRMEDGNQAAGRVLTSDANGTATWQNASQNAWGLTGNTGTNPSTNFIGTSDNQDVVFRRNNVISGRIGLNNNAIGRLALSNNSTGTNNSAFGDQSLSDNTTGLSNSAFGSQVLLNNTIGNSNSAFGVVALTNNTTGSHNSAFGSAALRQNTTGTQNNAHGGEALRNNTTGSNNNAFGYQAMQFNTTGEFNNAFGNYALENNTTGVNNNAFGSEALTSNTTGNSNNAIGRFALRNNTTGGNNSAFGSEALRDNITGANNIAIGFQSLLVNTEGLNNVAIGVIALDANTTGDNNTAVGRGSLSDNIVGNGNTAVGREALFNSTGDNNTALGLGALSSVTSGSNNMGLGNAAQVANPANSNQVRIGNTAITLLSAQVALTTTSDSRWKTNIQPSNLGLDFIKELHPVFYTRKDVTINEGKTTILETTSNPTTEYGFIAQDLEGTLLKFGATNNGIINKDSDGMYGVRYNDLMAPMVKAIQEQQVIIEELKAKIEKLENGK